MARPRKPSAQQKLKGAFEHDPARAREDVAGTGVFDKEPPKSLHKNYHSAWRYIVERLPAFSFTASDEPIVAHAARLLGQAWEYEQHLETTLRIHGPLMSCFQALGLSPSARVKMGDFGKSNGKKNKFDDTDQ